LLGIEGLKKRGSSLSLSNYLLLMN